MIQFSDISNNLQSALMMGEFLSMLGLAFLGGLANTLTSPCIYPLIPMTLSAFGAKQAKNKLHAFLLALSYLMGMVLLYCVLGISFALAGKVFGSLFTSQPLLLFLGGFCFLMTLSMLGLFELRLPFWLHQKLIKMGGQGHRGAFIMGLVSGLIAAPCTGPVLFVILTFIATARDIPKGGLAMFSYGVGMGLPFLILATFSSLLSKMPKSGQWMDWFKSIMAIFMGLWTFYYLQIAVPFLFHPIKPYQPWLAYAALLLGLGIGAVHLKITEASFMHKMRKIIGVLLGSFALSLFIFLPTTTNHTPTPHWIKNEQEGLHLAAQKHRPVIIDFYAAWCAACKELDQHVFSQASVQAELARFTAIKVDATEESDDINALFKKYNIIGLPTVVFIDSQGQIKEIPRVTGFIEAPAFIQLSKQVK